MTVFFLFLLALAAGALSTVFWVPGEDLGRGYFQVGALIVLGLLALALAVALLYPMRPFGPHQTRGTLALAATLLAAFGYYAAVWRQRWRLAWIPASAALVGSTALLLISGSQLIPLRSALPHRPLLLTLALLSGALLLGWSLITMLLGHWYLVVPRLTFRHLVLFCTVLLALVLARWLAVGATLVTAYSLDPLIEPHPWRLLVALDGQGMFFWFRLLWGLAIPLLLAWMSLHCARNRSNQSATGILYVLVVGSLIGEITGLYLTLSTGVPV